MYLSSHRLGDHPGRLLTLLRSTGPVAVIANALDAAPADVRTHGVHGELAALQELGLAAEELDLRHYFAGHQRLAETLADYRLVWLRGGKRSCSATPSPAVGPTRSWPSWSGATCWSGPATAPDTVCWPPSLRGLELLVDPGAVRAHYGAEPIWEGMGLLACAIVPHYRSQHPQSAAAELVVARYRAEGVPYQALRDGQAIVIDA